MELEMQTIPNPLLNTYQQQIEASRHIAEVVFDGADRMEHLLLDATRKAFDERMQFYQALAAVRDPQGVAALQSAFFSHTPEKMLKVQQELMQVVTQTQEEVNQTMLKYRTGLNGNGLQTNFASSLNDSNNGNSYLTSMFSMWDKAFKDTVAMATGTVTSILTTPQGEHAEKQVTQKSTARKSTRAK
jgi:phasin family protein